MAQELQAAPSQTEIAVRATTPMDMLATALERGMSTEVLSQLMTLQERWQAGQSRQAFDAAIASAKAKIKPIVKNRKVDFTSAKGRTNYEYEDLGEIARSVDPILAEFGLSYRFRARQEGKRVYVTCVLTHRDGHFEENELGADNDESGNKNSIQAVGSTLTYLQRYSLRMALGLAASKDDDGKGLSSSAPISADQVRRLSTLLEESGSDPDKFCKWMKVAAVSEIKAADFRKAESALTAAMQRKGDA